MHVFVDTVTADGTSQELIRSKNQVVRDYHQLQQSQQEVIQLYSQQYKNCVLTSCRHEREQQLMREKEQAVREKEELRTAKTRGQEEVSSSDSRSVIVTSSYNGSHPQAVSHEHC